MKLRFLRQMILNEDAQGLVEYSLIIALVAIVVIAGLTVFSRRFTNVTNNVTNSLGDT